MNNTPVVSLQDLEVIFKGKQGFIDQYILRKKKLVHAVDGLNLDIAPGEIVSLVGESGSGKTTTGRAILQLTPLTSGKVLFKGEEIEPRNRQYMRNFRREAQMIFQDPYQSLNPRFNVFEIVTEPLLFEDRSYSLAEKEILALQALEFAGLRPAIDYLYRFPHELSGGQRQRVSIATCFIMSPDFIIADEPVSMLDASVRADILKLFVNMKEERNTAFLFITHDLSLAWLISDRVAIMYLGKVMEIGPADIISGKCQHPYSQALTSVLAMVGEERRQKKILLEGETPSPIDIPSGCRFHPRCPIAVERCRVEEPPYHEVCPGQFVSCHFPGPPERLRR
ncbi:MAG TPA: ABC transporter ATP-binding protein [Tissierellia bacterium]|jgi:peptide/nickel transport system ATP-binding protein|nr:ABC transporter ATP-binding protein [Tissierellia bacterium]